jgi:hypothetical protein
MRQLERLVKLEARLKPKSIRYPAPALVGYVSPNGEPVEAFAIDQLLHSWPLTVERQWHRQPGEDMNAFAARVIEEAQPGALLVMTP